MSAILARCDERMEVELRDLDQTVPGNPARDLVRLALSLAMAASSSDLPGVVTARLVEEPTSRYLDAFARPDAGALATDDATVRFVVREALRWKWRHLHRERIGERGRPDWNSRAHLPRALSPLRARVGKAARATKLT